MLIDPVFEAQPPLTNPLLPQNPTTMPFLLRSVTILLDVSKAVGGLQGEAKPREFGMAVAGRTSSKVEEEFQEGINSEAEDSDIMLYTGLFFLEK